MITGARTGVIIAIASTQLFSRPKAPAYPAQRNRTAQRNKTATHQRLLQPIRDLAQIIPLERAAEVRVRVVAPEELRAEPVCARGGHDVRAPGAEYGEVDHGVALLAEPDELRLLRDPPPPRECGEGVVREEEPVIEIESAFVLSMC